MNSTAQKIIGGALVLLLVLSVAGNILLGYSLSNKTKEAATLSNQLSETNSKLSESQANLETTTETLKKKSDALKDISKKYTDVFIQLGKVMCSDTISPESIQTISTNQALIDPITKVAEKYYADTSVTTTFELLWNNTKTAIFTITWPDQFTSKILVSWGFEANKIQTILNVGDGCLFYIN
jgi:cell division protein FtsB